MTQMVCYGAIFFNVFVNPIALDAIGWRYYIVFVIILVVIIITIYFFYPETNGHSLEGMAVVFDGPSADVSVEVEGPKRDVKVLHTENVV